MSQTPLPFLLLSTRPELEAAEAEYASFRALMGLDSEQLIQIRVNEEPLPEITLDDYSGIILGGGPLNATEPEKGEHQLRIEADLAGLVRRIIAADFPFFGTCYGIGIVALTVGSPLSRTYGETPSCITVQVSPEGKADPLFAGMPDSFSTLVGHVEAADAVPENGVLLVSGENCPVQMYRLGENVYITQFHPELEPETFAQRLRIYKNNGYYDLSEYDRIAGEAFRADLTVDNALLRNFRTRYEKVG